VLVPREVELRWVFPSTWSEVRVEVGAS